MRRVLQVTVERKIIISIPGGERERGGEEGRCNLVREEEEEEEEEKEEEKSGKDNNHGMSFHRNFEKSSGRVYREFGSW